MIGEVNEVNKIGSSLLVTGRLITPLLRKIPLASVVSHELQEKYVKFSIIYSLIPSNEAC